MSALFFHTFEQTSRRFMQRGERLAFSRRTHRSLVGAAQDESLLPIDDADESNAALSDRERVAVTRKVAGELGIIGVGKAIEAGIVATPKVIDISPVTPETARTDTNN